ncbi:hypothetical protein ECTP14_02280 [Escherichia coli O157 typing phage 14]|uniref:Uncharacterized protein n=1 Tax=Escherichia coli O157 typing phage 14 TaxID=1508676 RepID=A0A0F6R991_9CAUD|nr:hypothetical protein ECTP14_02280 [Escherichia coli O157 typing phage 14]
MFDMGQKLSTVRDTDTTVRHADTSARNTDTTVRHADTSARNTDTNCP